MPAYERAFAEHEAEIAAIAGQPEPPTFDNTIVALENAGRALQRVDDVFGQLVGADSNDTLLAIERDISPRTAAHWNKVRMNDGAVRAASTRFIGKRDSLGLTAEQTARAGAPSHQVSPRGRGARRRQEASASPPSSSGWRRSAPRSARTCWPTSSPTRWSSTARPISPACRTSCARRRAAAADRARHEGQARHHPAALQRRAVPAVLVAARSAREGVPRLDRARRQRRQDRQQGDHRRDHGAARRARQAARLSDVRAIPARRRHGEDAGGGARAAGKGLEAGAQGARSPTATPCRS